MHLFARFVILLLHAAFVHVRSFPSISSHTSELQIHTCNMESSKTSAVRRNSSKHLLAKSRSKDFEEFVRGDKDPLLEAIFEDDQSKGSVYQLNWPITRLENTYRLEPKTRFPHAKAERIIAQELESVLEEVEYSPQGCLRLASELCETLKNKMKGLNIPRYKLVALVHVGEKSEQGMRIGSRCLWNTDTDTFSSASYSNSSLFAVGTIYASYLE